MMNMTTNKKNRHNQDEYDVIQAKEEFESMIDPRTLVLKQEVTDLENKVEDLKEEIKELKNDEG
jgi:polyhydroxyalkanoate synthesis regulator phasin